VLHFATISSEPFIRLLAVYDMPLYSSDMLREHRLVFLLASGLLPSGNVTFFPRINSLVIQIIISSILLETSSFKV
jgi:hypothetical protein